MALESEDSFLRFRSMIAMQSKTLDGEDTPWKYYDFGNKNAEYPLILLHGITGTCDIFYKQFLSLCPKGYRLISVHWPPYWTHDGWCKGIDSFLDAMKVSKCHIFGTSLGGFLAQLYASYRPSRVVSLILSNTFSDTNTYAATAPYYGKFSILPEFLLKRMLLSNFPETSKNPNIIQSVDFMVKQVEACSQRDIASRFTLNCISAFIPKLSIEDSRISIIDTLDEDIAIPEEFRAGVYEKYPNARKCLIKTGGNFPFLAESLEFNMHLEVHLRSVENQLNQEKELLAEWNDKNQIQEKDKEGEKD